MLKELAIKKDKKLKGKDMLSFDDYQYESVNQYLFDIMLEQPIEKEIKNDSDQSSEMSGSEPDSDEDDEFIKKKQAQQYRLFEEDEVIEIEEAQETNAFDNLIND